MKKLTLLLILINLSSIHSQVYYFSQKTETYAPLQNANSVNKGVVWGGFQTFKLNLGFEFPFMDKKFTTVDFEVTGRLIFDLDHYYFADMFVALGMKDKGVNASLSPISSTLVGIAPNRIFKLQVSNAGLTTSLAATMNYQIWIFEDGTLEYHTGPNMSVTQSGIFTLGGPYSGVFQIESWTPLKYKEGTLIYADPQIPKDSSFKSSSINTSNYALNYSPSEGTVYIYSRKKPSSINEVSKQKINYFLDAKNRRLLVDKNQDEVMLLYDVTGKQLLRTTERILDFNYSGGIYFVHVRDQIIRLMIY